MTTNFQCHKQWTLHNERSQYSISRNITAQFPASSTTNFIQRTLGLHCLWKYSYSFSNGSQATVLYKGSSDYTFFGNIIIHFPACYKQGTYTNEHLENTVSGNITGQFPPSQTMTLYNESLGNTCLWKHS